MKVSIETYKGTSCQDENIDLPNVFVLNIITDSGKEYEIKEIFNKKGIRIDSKHRRELKITPIGFDSISVEC